MGSIEMIPGEPSFRVVILHILFNGALIVVFTGFVAPIARALDRLFVEPPKPIGRHRSQVHPLQGG